MNGRLHRWSFRRLQTVIEYKAKLAGINVVYEDAYKTSSLCPICGEELSPNGYRELKCRKCGLVADRDVVGAWSLLKRHVGSPVPPERLQMKALMPDGGRPTEKLWKLTVGQNGFIHHPRILFLDEPTLSLDVQTRRAIWSYIMELNKRGGHDILDKPLS